jgi:hypothetical protein
MKERETVLYSVVTLITNSAVVKFYGARDDHSHRVFFLSGHEEMETSAAAAALPGFPV